MPDPTPLSPDQILTLINDDLCTFVTPMGGKTSLAGDPGDVVEALFDKPTGFRVVLHMGGDKEATENPIGGITTYAIEAWLIKAKGMPLRTGSQLVEGKAGSDPLLKILSDVKSRIRSLVFPDVITSRYIQYRGTEQTDPLLTQDVPTVSWKMTFELTAAMPAQEYREL